MSRQGGRKKEEGRNEIRAARADLRSTFLQKESRQVSNLAAFNCQLRDFISQANRA